jgi:NAD(P)-dependent dehydrogenase (short-subunit alcohol dehydrogenase family)
LRPIPAIVIEPDQGNSPDESGEAALENQAALEFLRDLPAKIVIHRADVGEEADVRSMFDEIRATMPPVRGVVHTAAVFDDVQAASKLSTHAHCGSLPTAYSGRFAPLRSPRLSASTMYSSLNAGLTDSAIFARR